MTAIVENDAAQRAILQAMLHGSTAVGSVDDLSSLVQNTPQEFAVVIGPSITSEDATAFAQWARVNRPDLGVILLRDIVDASALSLALRSGMRHPQIARRTDLGGDRGIGRAPRGSLTTIGWFVATVVALSIL